jgi:hypothetical protein
MDSKERDYLMGKKFQWLCEVRGGNPLYARNCLKTVDDQILDVMTVDEFREIYELAKPAMAEGDLPALSSRILEVILGRSEEVLTSSN